jgi:hypothetical protein
MKPSHLLAMVALMFALSPAMGRSEAPYENPSDGVSRTVPEDDDSLRFQPPRGPALLVQRAGAAGVPLLAFNVSHRTAPAAARQDDAGPSIWAMALAGWVLLSAVVVGAKASGLR